MSRSESVQEFAASLPAAYRSKYRPPVIGAHAEIAGARGTAPVLARVFDEASQDGAGICIVADDQPGLLFKISAAFLLNGLDVVSAEAYTRRTVEGRPEAVDLFWLRKEDARRQPSPVTDADVRNVSETLVELMEGKLDARDVLRAHRSAPAQASSPPAAVVRFLEDESGELTTLEVETEDRAGLLLTLTHALFETSVQIVRSELHTLDHRVFDHFSIVEHDGSPIRSARRLEIQVAVLGALEPAKRSSSISRR